MIKVMFLMDIHVRLYMHRFIINKRFIRGLVVAKLAVLPNTKNRQSLVWSSPVKYQCSLECTGTMIYTCGFLLVTSVSSRSYSLIFSVFYSKSKYTFVCLILRLCVSFSSALVTFLLLWKNTVIKTSL